MKTTIRVSLSGIAFNLDENAYKRLKSYLEDLSLGFGNDKEIIDDIEARIADLLLTRIKTQDQAVRIDDISEIIEIIGQPEEINPEEENSKNEFKQQFDGKSQASTKRLYRDTGHRVIGGVCSGLAHYLKLDVIWIRLTFVFLMFVSVNMNSFNGWGIGSRFFFGIPLVIAVYIILWLVIPAAKTSRQKLNMYSAEPNKDYPSIGESSNPLINFTKNFFRILIKICVFTVLITIILISIAFVITGIVGLVGGHWLGGENFISLIHYIDLGISYTWPVTLALSLWFFIPALLLIYYSLKILIGFKYKDKPVAIILSITWILLSFFIAGKGIAIFQQYSHHSRIYKEEIVTEINKDKKIQITIDDNLEPYIIGGINFRYPPIYKNIEEPNAIYLMPQIQIITVDSISDIYIGTINSANAISYVAARKKAETIGKSYILSDSNKIIIKPTRYDKTKKWATETTVLRFYIPKATGASINKELQYINMHQSGKKKIEDYQKDYFFDEIYIDER